MLDEPQAQSQHVADRSDSKSQSGSELLSVLQRRKSLKPFQLSEPGPSDGELQELLTVAMRVPDHGGLEPWRIVSVRAPARDTLVARLSEASRTANANDPAAADLAVRKIANLFSAPLTCIVISRTEPSAKIPEWEQVLSAGAVCMNLITAATALGYSANWLTGWTAYNAAAAPIIGLQPNEKVAGIIPIGTAKETAPDRPRPALEKRTTLWQPA
ncbi:MAG TPA: nitroreductase [Xanthobacteraceae bacterium]|nr:nitroreductase [Xanthobacteraceae bacterium]